VEVTRYDLGATLPPGTGACQINEGLSLAPAPGEVAAHGLAREGAGRHRLQRRTVVELLAVLQERGEELAVVRSGAPAEAGAGPVALVPARPHRRPERLRALAVVATGRVVEVREALVAVEPDLLGDHRLPGERATVLVEHHLQVLLLLDPAGRRDGELVGADE